MLFLFLYNFFPLLFSLMIVWFQGLFIFMNKKYEGMFMETQGLWDVVVNQFLITTFVELVFFKRSVSIKIYATT